MNQENHTNQELAETSPATNRISSKMTFFDSDSIYNQFFQTESTLQDGQLNWKIDFFEDNKLTYTILDSINSMSYLVDAVDLNGDSIGELVVVTGNFSTVTDNFETFVCQIFCYVKVGNSWTKRLMPILNHKYQSTFLGNETVSIKNKKIVRELTIYDAEKKDTRKKRTLIYGLNKDLQLIVLKEK